MFYFEACLETDLLTPPSELAKTLGRKWQEIPAAVESHLASINPDPFWRRVAFRLPSMLRFVVEQTRWGVDRGQFVLNGVLPGVAAHNLTFAADMLLTAHPEGSPPERPSGVPPPRTIEEVLAAKISLRFDQESLESAMQSVVQEVQSTYPDSPAKFAVRILGDDLKLDGITRNQQIRAFAQENKTVGEVLTALVMRANPVTTVRSPSEQDQKLLWVVAPDPDDASRSVVLVTTRQVAAGKYTLSNVFQSPE